MAVKIIPSSYFTFNLHLRNDGEILSVLVTYRLVLGVPIFVEARTCGIKLDLSELSRDSEIIRQIDYAMQNNAAGVMEDLKKRETKERRFSAPFIHTK